MNIAELMAGIRHLDIVLPEFQREYVWTLEQAKQLMVSLYRDYPTGCLLFWKTNTPPDLKNTVLPKDTIGTTQVILDGQQRLTTLYLLIEGQIPPYYRPEDIKTDPGNLYFDLDTGEFLYYQVTRMKNNPTWVSVRDCFSPSNKVQVFEIVQRKIATKNGATAEQFQLAQRYNDNLTKLRSILNKDYPIQIVPSSADIDAAIDVFDRVNSLGTKLTEADLALTHITGKWPAARKKMKEKILELEQKGFAFDLTFMVRSLIAVVHGRALYELIHRTEAQPILIGWEKLTRVLDYLVQILPGHAYIHSTSDLNATNVLVPVIAYLARHEEKFRDEKELKHCIHWIYAASMWSRYSGQTDQRLDHDITVIQKHASPWPELIKEIVEQRGRIEVDPGDLIGSGIQHPLYRMAFVLAKTRGAVNWFNGSPLSAPSNADFALNNRYIFPFSLLYAAGKYSAENPFHKQMVNEIANRAFFTGDSGPNGVNQAPADYLPQVERHYPGALTKQFVPLNPHLWELDKFEDFLRARRELIAQALNDHMKQLIADPGPEQTVVVENLLKQGESDTLEYKSSLRWDLKLLKNNPDLEKVIYKTISAFMNTKGGILLIGVADNGTVLGVEHDLSNSSLPMNMADRDKYEQLFRNLFLKYLDLECFHFMSFSLRLMGDRTIAIVQVQPSTKPVYLKGNNTKEFYIRTGNASSPLDIAAANNYVHLHWQAAPVHSNIYQIAEQ